MRDRKTKMKKGAASFYIVAFSTLILLIVATSFAAIIISEITRTSNDDLSQSAYDSALAGVEDAKLAFYSYQDCLTKGKNDAECGNLLVSATSDQNCYGVARYLGRIGQDESREVAVREITGDGGNNNMQQAYTCVEMSKPNNYIGDMSSAQQTKIVKIKFDQVRTADAKVMKVSWFNSDDAGTDFEGHPVDPSNGSLFSKTHGNLPIISVAMVQTAENFKLDDFQSTKGNRTDRGMVYLVPMSKENAGTNKEDVYIGAYNGKENFLGEQEMLKSNDKTAKKLPYGVYCGGDEDPAGFMCSALIKLPDPVIGNDKDTRNDETFMFALSLPYGTPTTHFSLEFFKDDGGDELNWDDGSGVDEQTAITLHPSVQVAVDSTGRANDLYRRVEARLESAANSSFLTTMGPLELLGGDDSSTALLEKTDLVTCEYDFGERTCDL